ncbi:MAG: alpha/beta hydrolase [Gemmatimonadota bacterium]|nr:alpha/beta hydrolase [Gemmatimonadota bacterium]
MSLIRLSVLKDIPFAPRVDGTIEMGSYNRRPRHPIGSMDPLKPPQLVARNSDFFHYVERTFSNAVVDSNLNGPLVVMVHGFLYDPKAAISKNPKDTDNPHGRVYHFTRKPEPHEQRHHTASWPLGLGFSNPDDGGNEGLAVAFGWQSQPGFASSLLNHFQNFYARAYDNASQTAWVLVNLIKVLADIVPNKPIDIICHSLGSRVVLRGLTMVAKRDADEEGAPILRQEESREILKRLGRVIILGGAEYVVEAQLLCRRIERQNLANGPHFYNIVSRENDVLDKLGENFGPRTFGNSQVIGHNGLSTKHKTDYWIDLQIDSEDLQHWMEQNRNLNVSGDRPWNVWDHWYYYTHRGNMEMYEKILRSQRPNGRWSIERLRNDGVPDGVPLRWWHFGD